MPLVEYGVSNGSLCSEIAYDRLVAWCFAKGYSMILYRRAPRLASPLRNPPNFWTTFLLAVDSTVVSPEGSKTFTLGDEVFFGVCD